MFECQVEEIGSETLKDCQFPFMLSGKIFDNCTDFQVKFFTLVCKALLQQGSSQDCILMNISHILSRILMEDFGVQPTSLELIENMLVVVDFGDFVRSVKKKSLQKRLFCSKLLILSNNNKKLDWKSKKMPMMF